MKDKARSSPSLDFEALCLEEAKAKWMIQTLS